MAKIAALALTLLSALSSLTAASSCKTGLMYCGYNLLSKGDYYGEITAELRKHRLPTDDSHIQKSLFTCGIGGDGWIGYNTYCEGFCEDGGDGRSDFCA